MLQDNLVLLWTGLFVGSALCLVSTGRTGFAVSAAAAAVCGVQAFAGVPIGVQELSFCLFVGSAAAVRSASALLAAAKRAFFLRSGRERSAKTKIKKELQNKFTNNSVRRP
ncbi:MAG: hypothetical protein IJV00_03180 [Clostridia bacterium]|nr:hypothetical protein [Clostridia bacterium]